jgi:hydroxybutyrate-dimer hydrolase
MTIALISRAPRVSTLALLTLLAACDRAPPPAPAPTAKAAPPRVAETTAMFTAQRSSVHRDGDDLLSAGLGLDGLRAMTPPAFGNPEAPTPDELRRRALWSNWRGIADLTPAGGFGTLYGELPNVPGREFQAFATVPGATQPHRVLAQIPDAFDNARRCLVVTASSGSRGIYGAIAVAGPWALPKGCAVAYTDKGAGTDYYDLAQKSGVRIDGTRGGAEDTLAFKPDSTAADGIAFKHAHSKDNPEADWGRHVKQAAEFGLHALNEALPQHAPFTFDNTRVIAVGISNGGGAVLRAAELEGDWLKGVVAGEPNVYVEATGARTLFDYTTEAALLMPCALPKLGLPAAPDVDKRCAAAVAAGLISGSDLPAQQAAAYEALRANGWTDAALRAGSISVTFDLWRAIAVTYAASYGRYGAGEEPCIAGFSAVNGDGSARASTNVERAAWWSDASGIPPGAGVGFRVAKPAEPHDALNCLRALWTGSDAAAARVKQGIAATQAGLPRKGLPVIVVHGLDDGVVPAAFSSAPYVAKAKAAGADLRYWQIRNAQHFDAFLGLPQYGAAYVPMLPYVYRALDRVWAQIDGKTELPADAVIETTPRGMGKALEASHLALP